MDELNERQKRFCDNFISTGMKKESAIKAGYSAKSAHAMASSLLKNPKCQAYIEKRLAELESERIADAREVLQFWTSVMRGEHVDTVPVLAGNGYQELQEKPVDNQHRIKAADSLAKVLGMYNNSGPAYGIGQPEDDPLSRSLKEEAARLDAE